jgi:hypothetical protein
MTIVEKPLNPENGRCIGAETDASEPVGEEPVGEAPVARNVDDPAERDNVVLDAKPVEVLGRRPDKIPVADSVEVSIIDDGDTIVSVLPVPKPKLSIVLVLDPGKVLTRPEYGDASVKCGRLDRLEVIVPIRKRDKLDVSGIADARVALTAEDDKGIGRPGL